MGRHPLEVAYFAGLGRIQGCGPFSVSPRASPCYYVEAGKTFSTNQNPFVILRVFVSSWRIGGGIYHEGAKTRRIVKFLVAAGLLRVYPRPVVVSFNNFS